MKIPVKFEAHTCSVCGIVYALTTEFANQRRANHKTFWCPNGDAQYWPQKLKAELLQAKLERIETQLETCQIVGRRRDYQKRYWKGALTKLLRASK